ncbi:MAG TPA: DNA mismatch repair endonuclease MutL [Pyrinomonadaceae bacterium]|nr:DNA mismatch repair endonuclease MutL [Pyrinomonadaceae bacterium]
MSKIRVLSDHIANQIAAGEVVERPASVAKELVENSIDAGARRVEIDVEAGGRRLLRIADDGEGMTRDDAVLAFERHATSKISTTDDLNQIRTLGFRGEALASIASVARVELVTQQEGEREGTRVLIEGGRMRDVSPAARPRGTTISVRDLFFNVPARRKFLRSEATESFHLTNLVTHYALAHPEIAFVLTNNGREVLRAASAANLRERAYQIFGAEFLDSLLEVGGGHALVARVGGYVSAPRERRTSRDAQYLFVNGRYVRDRLVARALSEGYRSVLPNGVYPAALLFLEVPLEEVDVNVHPAKTEVRFRRAAAVADAVRDAVRAALAGSGFLRLAAGFDEQGSQTEGVASANDAFDDSAFAAEASQPQWGETPSSAADASARPSATSTRGEAHERPAFREEASPRQEAIEFGWTPPAGDAEFQRREQSPSVAPPVSDATLDADAQSERASALRPEESTSPRTTEELPQGGETQSPAATPASVTTRAAAGTTARDAGSLPPLNSASGLVREVAAPSLSSNIRPLGQLEDSFIIATDPEGLLLIDQHVAHERILFDKYRALEGRRAAESQNLLVPETFDLTPAQASAFDQISDELELYGFGLMRLSGRTVAIRAVPADLPASGARNLLGELLDTVDAERRTGTRETMRDEIAASLACRAAIKINMPLTEEKMRWLIDRLLLTSSPTTCPHGRPIILRLTKRDIERGFHRP